MCKHLKSSLMIVPWYSYDGYGKPCIYLRLADDEIGIFLIMCVMGFLSLLLLSLSLLLLLLLLIFALLLLLLSLLSLLLLLLCCCCYHNYYHYYYLRNTDIYSHCGQFLGLFLHHPLEQWGRCRLKSPASRLLSQPFLRRKSKKTSKPRVTGLCEGNPPVTGGFPSQRARNVENIYIWWRRHYWPKGYFVHLTDTGC